MNAFMISVSLGLQYGVPLDVYVSKFCPHALRAERRSTNDPDIRAAKSIVDSSSAGWARSSSPSTSRRRSASSRPRCEPAWPPRTRERSLPRCRSWPRTPDARADGALQHARGRDRVLTLRGTDGQGGDVLHVPRLWDEHGLLLSAAGSQHERQAPRSRAGRLSFSATLFAARHQRIAGRRRSELMLRRARRTAGEVGCRRPLTPRSLTGSTVVADVFRSAAVRTGFIAQPTCRADPPPSRSTARPSRSDTRTSRRQTAFCTATRAEDPASHFNRWLRSAHLLDVPIVYFAGTRPKCWSPICPTYVERDSSRPDCASS